MGQLEEQIERARANFERLLDLERELTIARGGLCGHAAATAYDVAIDGVSQAKEALDQAEHELELEGGLYLDGEPAVAEPRLPSSCIDDGTIRAALASLAKPLAEPRCHFCGTGPDQPHDWRCPKPGSTR